MEEWLYKFPDVPQLPIEYESEIYKSFNQPEIDTFNWNNTLNAPFLVDGKLKKSTAFFQYDVSRELQKWVFDNVVDLGIANVKSAKTYQDDKDTRDFRGAHSDATRNYVIIWLLESGGKDHRTVFYREKNQPLIRENTYNCMDHSLLEEIGSLQVPIRKWTLLNSRILHAVLNIPKPRIALQVGLVSVNGVKGLN